MQAWIYFFKLFDYRVSKLSGVCVKALFKFKFKYRDFVHLLATTIVRVHLRLDQLYVVLRDGGRKVSGGFVF